MRLWTFGPDDAPPVLALHGLTGHGRRWQSLAEKLPAARIIAPDLLGHGDTGGDRGGWADQLAELVPLVQALPQPPVVVGHSFGGALAIRLAHRVPVRGLVLLDPSQQVESAFIETMIDSSLQRPPFPDFAAAAEVKRAEGWDEVAAGYLQRELETHLEPVEGGWQWRLSAGVIAAARALADPYVLPPTDIPVAAVRALATPGYFIPDSFYRELGPRARVHSVAVGHMVPLILPGLTADLTAAQLTR